MAEVVGPFTIEDGSPAEIERVKAVAARIPPAMAASDAGRQKVFFHKRPRKAPSWAWGYQPTKGRVWINPAETVDKQLYTIAHEYFHGWEDRHATPALRNALRALMGTDTAWGGGSYTKHKSSRPSEAAADSFARSIGFGKGLLPGFYTLSVPAAAHGAFLATLLGGAARSTTPKQDKAGGGAVAPNPLPTQRRRRSPEPDHRPRRRIASLRPWPGQAAPVTRQVAFGGQIATGRGLTGGAYEVNGRHGSWWLEVVAVDGQWIAPPLWVPALELQPLRAQPSPPVGSARASRVSGRAEPVLSGTPAPSVDC